MAQRAACTAGTCNRRHVGGGHRAAPRVRSRCTAGRATRDDPDPHWPGIGSVLYAGGRQHRLLQVLHRAAACSVRAASAACMTRKVVQDVGRGSSPAVAPPAPGPDRCRGRHGRRARSVLRGGRLRPAPAYRVLPAGRPASASACASACRPPRRSLPSAGLRTGLLHRPAFQRCPRRCLGPARLSDRRCRTCAHARA